MKTEDLPVVSSETPSSTTENSTVPRGRVQRRSFLKGLGAAGAALSAGALLSIKSQAQTGKSPSTLTKGDSAILRFLAAAELLETDLWQQYAELGGVTPGTQNPYQNALQQLDGDGSQYITSNTLDELSHAEFLNAYLISKGQEPVDLDGFRNLPSSQATGAQQTGRLTNLMKLHVDTSWFVRYRSQKNPDFGAKFPQAIKIVNRPAIPLTDDDFNDPNHIQAIANTAAFHFAMIEQGGSSLYSAMAQKVRNAEVLQIVLSIGGDEVAHFLEWMDFAGNAAAPPLAPLTDGTLTFPDLNQVTKPTNLQTNLIFPVPCEFISPDLPRCAVIRPTNPQGIAMGAVQALTNDQLFAGQSRQFFQTLQELATEADAAQRGF